MRVIKVLLVVFLAMNVIGCKPSTEKKAVPEAVNLPTKLLTTSIDIEGMTCEIGCAKIIESKVSKIEGVTESKVSFEDKKGIFVYDSNKTSKEEIISTINGLVDGKTYSGTESKEHSCEPGCEKPCCAVKEKATCSKACADKCGHKEGEACTKVCDKTKKDTCKPGCEKACCATKK
ncbi:heavy-metal-associated domain-containing protein [Wenyingzhuangia aestuarii]|uniref:heavy-metal-associated domain-containing protein n=1 Tax=Wenyingzhuangia aestuarii TaxID=1647582 RepID=UPI001438FB76|nr:heavy-metal-associated domain-containing protein [Wenyingzhuangia aestuarii]NJB81330.1 copper chaperone CopZ [Wenyingzhuangia aestuarii]